MFSAAIVRGACFLALWLMLAGNDLADLPGAVIAVVTATWASLRLLPPGARSLSLVGLAGLVGRLPYQSAIAGVDVARRALDPRLPLRPGFVTCHTQHSAGIARSAFCAWTSLLPGALPAGSDESGALLIHCLDTGQPVAAQLAAEEARFFRALGGELADG